MTKRVLVIGDMQKDYDVAANVALYGEIRSPYANPIASIVPAINALVRAEAWDLVVFTFDWLPASMERAFCLTDSPGAALLDELDVDAANVFFKKSSDDSFCETGGEPEATTQCAQLAGVFSARGFAPQDTLLVFAGQRFERCMLKTVMHARALGYACTVVEDASYTKDAEPDPEWPAPPADALAVGADVAAWAAEVSAARKSAGGRLARGYMLAAGVRIVPTWPA